MLLYDASTHDRQLALIHDAASGNVLDAMVEREHRTRRFFPRDCRVLKVDLRPMDSAVNRITNLRGELDAECEAAGDRLSAPCHVPVLPLTSAAIRCGRIWTPARPEAVRLVRANKTAATEPRCALSQPAAREARALIEMCPR